MGLPIRTSEWINRIKWGTLRPHFKRRDKAAMWGSRRGQMCEAKVQRKKLAYATYGEKLIPPNRQGHEPERVPGWPTISCQIFSKWIILKRQSR